MPLDAEREQRLQRWSQEFRREARLRLLKRVTLVCIIVTVYWLFSHTRIVWTPHSKLPVLRFAVQWGQEEERPVSGIHTITRATIEQEADTHILSQDSDTLLKERRIAPTPSELGSTGSFYPASGANMPDRGSVPSVTSSSGTDNLHHRGMTAGNIEGDTNEDVGAWDELASKVAGLQPIPPLGELPITKKLVDIDSRLSEPTRTHARIVYHISSRRHLPTLGNLAGLFGLPSVGVLLSKPGSILSDGAVFQSQGAITVEEYVFDLKREVESLEVVRQSGVEFDFGSP